MADEKNTPNGGDPTKIRLNPGKTGTGDTDKIKLSGAAQQPPKIQLRAADAKKSTTRIDLADVLPPTTSVGGDDIRALPADQQAAYFKKSTIRIEQTGTPAGSQTGSVPEAKRTTMRIDQPSGQTQPMQGDTARIDVKKTTIKIDQQAQGETGRIEAKKATMRIDQPASGQTQPVIGDTGKIEGKRSTIRIDQGPATTGDTQKVQGETARIDVKKSTIRIDAIPQTGSSDTQRTGGETKRIDLKTVETGQMPSAQPAAPAATPAGMSETQRQQNLKKETTRLEIPAEVIKRQTGRITIAPAAEPPDVFKKRTAPVTVPAAPGAAASEGADTVARPKTIQIRRPAKPSGDVAPVAVPAAVTQSMQARKSETARLEIPKEVTEDRPTTRPKTIRIKRPDGTTARKQLTVSRPTEAQESELPEGLRQPVAAAAVSDAPGAFWSVLALVALLVVCAVVYILLAQTYAKDLPFPGKIPGLS